MVGARGRRVGSAWSNEPRRQQRRRRGQWWRTIARGQRGTSQRVLVDPHGEAYVRERVALPHAASLRYRQTHARQVVVVVVVCSLPSHSRPDRQAIAASQRAPSFLYCCCLCYSTAMPANQPTKPRDVRGRARERRGRREQRRKQRQPAPEAQEERRRPTGLRASRPRRTVNIMPRLCSYRPSRACSALSSYPAHFSSFHDAQIIINIVTHATHAT